MKRDHLTLGDVLAIHADQITTYGGAGGIRDPGQLDAALFRPQTGYYADIIAEAAALWESLSQNHPFVDGNKRTAFAAMFTFLSINGVDVTADADQAWAFVSHLRWPGSSSDAHDPWALGEPRDRRFQPTSARRSGRSVFNFSKIPSMTLLLPANNASGPPACTLLNGAS